MHQTTVRFGRDLWRMLEHEAAASGVSVAQYVREAALARAAYAAGWRSADSSDEALRWADPRFEPDHGPSSGSPAAGTG